MQKEQHRYELEKQLEARAQQQQEQNRPDSDLAVKGKGLSSSILQTKPYSSSVERGEDQKARSIPEEEWFTDDVDTDTVALLPNEQLTPGIFFCCQHLFSAKKMATEANWRQTGEALGSRNPLMTTTSFGASMACSSKTGKLSLLSNSNSYQVDTTHISQLYKSHLLQRFLFINKSEDFEHAEFNGAHYVWTALQFLVQRTTFTYAGNVHLGRTKPRDCQREQNGNWLNQFTLALPMTSQIPEEQPQIFDSSIYDQCNNPDDMEPSSSSQWDTFSLGHHLNAESLVFPMNERSLYPGATSPPAHVYGNFLRRSSTASLPSTLSHMPNCGLEDLQYSHFDPGMAAELWEMLDYLPPGFVERSPAKIEAFCLLSRQAQLDENQARLVRCGWTDQGGSQICTVVTSAKDMRKHIEKIHNVPRPRRGEPARVCRWVHCGSSERDLYKHIGIVHLGLHQIPCASCKREFSRADNLKDHTESSSCGRREN
ncbi:hypothetical protein C8J56DRAFT_888552 [Mycena floridula]|nr:hypothetical protein C8J56DRAFT_888552 [Mycena floridula]